MFKSVALLGGLFLAVHLFLAACSGNEEPQPTPTPSFAAAQPSPTPEPTPTPAPTSPAGEASVGQLAFVGTDGAIWLVTADGSGRRQLTGDCPDTSRLDWSPSGDWISCQSGGGADTPSTFSIFDMDGRLLTSFRADATSFTWSPDGRRYVYTVTSTAGQTDLFVGDAADLDYGLSTALAKSPAWSPKGRDLAAYRPPESAIGEPMAFLDIYAIPSGAAGSRPGDYQPLAWVLGRDAILVAINYEPPRDLAGPMYEANVLDLASEELRRVPELDNGVPFWLSPAGEKAAFLGGKPMRGESGPEIAIIDFATLAVTPMPESTIGFPSEFIPSRHVVFSGDGSSLYWADVHFPTDIYRGAADGGEPTKLASLVDAVVVAFSPDRTKIAYIVGGNPPTLWTANIDGSEDHEIGPVFNAFAWRPTP